MELNKYHKILAVVAGIAVIVFVYSYYVQKQAVPGKSSFILAREKARDLYVDEKKSDVIPVLENELKNAPNKNAEASAKYVLAGAYIEVDFKKAIELFKAISSDDSYPPIWRARATTAMANYVMLNDYANDNYIKLIFSGDPYSTFAGTNGSNTLIGARKLYERASAFYVMPFSEYRIAEWHIKQAARIKLYGEKLDNPLSYHISKAKEHISKGDAAAVAFATQGKNTEFGHGEWLKGELYAILWDIEKKDEYKKTAEESFKKAFEYLDKADKAPESYIMTHKIWTSYSYEVFLMRAFANQRIEDIKKMTKFIDDNKNLMTQNGHTYGLAEYLTRVGNVKPKSGQARYDYDNALSLAKIDPVFKSFLNELGWKLK